MVEQPQDSELSGRSSLGILSGIITPYRLHLHRRLSREIPELNLVSFFIHRTATEESELGEIHDIQPVWLSDEIPGGHAISGPRNWHKEYRRAGKLIDEMRRLRVAAMVINGYNDMTRLRVLRWCRRQGIPAFVRGDSNVLGDRLGSPSRAFIKRQVLARILSMSSGVMPMGELGQAYFERYGADSRRCYWVPCEPDYDLFGVAPDAALAELREAFHLVPKKRYLLYAGRLIPLKRVDLLLDAFAAIAADRPEWDLLLAGEGELAGDLQRRVPPELADRVIWLGLLNTEKMRAAYHLAHVVVLPSDYEAWGLVINEAMAAGCVVVSSDVVGAANELVVDGVSGRVFPNGDLVALAAALRDVTDGESLRRYQAGVAPTLSAWRAKADPVAGVRLALREAGVLF
jgi:glycosyltransferase involved in cell wall biosynthesis